LCISKLFHNTGLYIRTKCKEFYVDLKLAQLPTSNHNKITEMGGTMISEIASIHRVKTVMKPLVSYDTRMKDINHDYLSNR